MRILGIHSGHNATACLYEDGRISAMASEERFTRNKNQSGFPQRAVEWLIGGGNGRSERPDCVAIAGTVGSMEAGNWEEGPWEKFASAASRFVPARIMSSRALVKPYMALRGLGGGRLQEAARHLDPFGIPASCIELVDHHEAHAHASYWLDFRRTNDKTLVVTLDNTGDGLCGTVYIADGNGGFERIHAMQSLCSVGMMYTAVTRYLGMKPVEDEYKVMGLAPYAKETKAEEVYQALRAHMDLSEDGLNFVNRSGLGEYAYVQRFRKEMRGYRFDHLAGGVQRLVEELALDYLKAWARKTGIRKLAVGGGVFMNVKLNMLIDECDEFEDAYFLPSCGDESIAAGAALKCAWSRARSAGETFDPEPLGVLHLGPEFTNDDAAKALESYADRLQWKKSDDVERASAEEIAGGRVLGRMRGRMEFGARSLGNRTILARADSLTTVHKINAAIKMRDFWMPFAPTILADRQDDYIFNERRSPAPYMILAFHSTPRAAKELIAGLHPFDRTCRPQLIEPEANPRFHKLMKDYEEITGCGGMLNTSFNLHGEPVVCSPVDAIETYLRSDLDVLTIEDYMVWSPERRERRT